MTTAIIYTRVSTERQTDGYSLDQQSQACRDHCARMGWEIGGEFVEAGASGRSRDKRPQLELAIAEVCRTKGVLVFYSLSRLARSVRDSLTISEQVSSCGGSIASVTDPIDTTTAAGKFVFTMLSAVCRMESDILGERVKAANETSKRKAGHRTQGKSPYGYRWNAELKERRPVKDEQLVIRDILQFRAEGLTYEQIATKLNDRGTPSPEVKRRNGQGKWARESVRRVLKYEREKVH